MLDINSVGLNRPLFCGVLDGSNAETKPSGVAISMLPVQAPPVITPPQRRPDPQQERWIMLDSALILLNRDGKYQTGDGKIKVEFYSAALNDPDIDHDNLDIAGAADGGKIPAITFYGEMSREGKFVVNSFPSEENGYIVIVVSDPLRNNVLPLGMVLSHEIKHALDFLSGKSLEYYNGLSQVIAASQGPAEEKEFYGKRCTTLIGEIRARLFQTDWVVSHIETVPGDREIMTKLMEASVGETSDYFGYRSYLFERNLDGQSDISVDGTKVLFNQLIDSVFEGAFSEFDIAALNKRLEPYKMRIDPSRQNPPAENEKLEKALTPRLE